MDGRSSAMQSSFDYYFVSHPIPSMAADHPGQCWIESKQLAVRPGELFYNSTDCTGYECFADLSHRVTSCGFGALNRGEEIPIDDHVIWSFYE